MLINSKYGVIIYMIWGLLNFVAAYITLPEVIALPVFKAIMFFAIGQYLCGKAIKKMKENKGKKHAG